MPVRAIRTLTAAEIINLAIIRTGIPQATWRSLNQSEWLIKWTEASDLIIPMKALAP